MRALIAVGIMTVTGFVLMFVMTWTNEAKALEVKTHCHPCRAEVVRVIDGDTVVLRINVWPQIHILTSVRLLGINAAETRTKSVCEKADGLKAKQRLVELLPQGERVEVWNISHGKYAGRVLGAITVEGQNVSRVLLAEQLVDPYTGGKREYRCSIKQN